MLFISVYTDKKTTTCSQRCEDFARNDSWFTEYLISVLGDEKETQRSNVEN